MGGSQRRWMAVLAAILLLLVVFVVWTDPPVDSEATGPEPAWPSLQRESIRLLIVERSGTGDTLRFEREGDSWWLREPRSVRADDRKVEDLLGRLVHLALERDLEVEDLAPFGLDSPPRLVIRFETSADSAAGSQEGASPEGDSGGGASSAHVLRVGSPTPVGGGTYVQLGEAAAPINVATSRFASDFEDPWETYRNHEVWEFTPYDVQGVRVHLHAADVVWGLERDDHGWWLHPSGERASREAVESFLREARDLRIASFGAEEAPEAESSDRLVIRTEEQDLVLLLGEHGERGVAARVPLASEPVFLEESALGLLTREPASFRFEALLPVRRSTVNRLEVELGARRVELRREDDAWSSPQAEPILDLLEDAERGPAVMGARPEPWGRVALHEGDSRSETLLLGPPGPDRHLAWEASGGPPFEVDVRWSQALGDLLEEGGDTAAPGSTPASEDQ